MSLTLHEEIADILNESKLPLTVDEITNLVNDRKNYVRNDGKDVPQKQISARISKYSKMFTKDGTKICLILPHKIDKAFEELVMNAIDFMKRALNCIDTDPKITVIFFWTSIELFVKARLLKEHWSLILTDPKNADLSAFNLGDFQSVSFHPAIKRLRKVCNESIIGSKNTCFEILRKHRNLLVHFFNKDYKKPINPLVIQRIALEQCRGWYFLHNWLTDVWFPYFYIYKNEIEEIHKLIKSNNIFFKAKYEEIKPEVDRLKANGESFNDCVVCNFDTAIENDIYKQSNLKLLKQECYVCEHKRTILRISCTDCGKNIDIEELGEGICLNCNNLVNIGDLVLLGEIGDPRDELIDPSNAYCSECDYFEDVVILLEDDRHLCLWCLNISDEVSECEFCGTKVTGDTEDSYFKGCVMCDGFKIPDD